MQRRDTLSMACRPRSRLFSNLGRLVAAATGANRLMSGTSSRHRHHRRPAPAGIHRCQPAARSQAAPPPPPPTCYRAPPPPETSAPPRLPPPPPQHQLLEQAQLHTAQTALATPHLHPHTHTHNTFTTEQAPRIQQQTQHQPTAHRHHGHQHQHQTQHRLLPDTQRTQGTHKRHRDRHGHWHHKHITKPAIGALDNIPAY
jgi:hypothetical protein